MKTFLHALILLAAILTGAILRFWNLDAKPLWMDEVITALFSFGQSYYDVPLEKVVSLGAIEQVFTFRADSTCADIAQTISVQSVHPPLFFCWLHNWLSLLQPIDHSWVWKVRSLPALSGVFLIPALYYLNRVAFSVPAGLAAAFVVAVSPFAVYLSQEARHYTIPMLLVTVSLVGLVRIGQDLRSHQQKLGVWLGWVAINSVGFYVHYFFILATIAQILTLILLLKLTHSRRSAFLLLILAVGGIGLTYLPWLPTFVSHFSRPETDWLQSTQPVWLQAIAPLYQLAAGWLLMTIALPVENQPLWVVIPSALLMLSFGGWLVWRVLRGMRRLWNALNTHWETLTLTAFVTSVLIEFLVIVYGLGKDITQVPRYNFIYYPAICALLAASLVAKRTDEYKNPTSRPQSFSSLLAKRNEVLAHPSSRSGTKFSLLLLLLVGLISCGFVVNDRVFLKPYHPQRVASNMLTSDSSLVVMAYEDFQEIALGLSFALALERLPHSDRTDFAFLGRSTQGYDPFWRKLTTLNTGATSPQNVWLIAPGLRKSDFPTQFAIGSTFCQIDDRYHRVGVPYQGYGCRNEK
ncbi:glycosyltransferase family 39 protein [Phormidesmis priestleyi]